MFNKSQKGFAALEGILIAVIVVLIGFVAWYAFHTKNSANNTYNNAGNTQLNPAPKQSSNTSTNTQPAGQIVQTKTNSKTGQYLADSKGMALYIYGADTNGVSNCAGSCLSNWPAYESTDTAATPPANVTVISRSDGTKQYAYKGMPLYYFTGDTSVGQVTGDNLEDFHVAKP